MAIAAQTLAIAAQTLASTPPQKNEKNHLQGLIWTAGTVYRLLHFLNLPVDVQEVCVFTAPLFSALTSLSAYALASEVRGRGPGLVAASLAAVVPSYVSRSVAGSYDNEGVAIFALVTVFWLYVKTLKVRRRRNVLFGLMTRKEGEEEEIERERLRD